MSHFSLLCALCVSAFSPLSAVLFLFTEHGQQNAAPHPLPIFRKDLIPKHLPGGVCKRYDSKEVTQMSERILALARNASQGAVMPRGKNGTINCATTRNARA
jgi:hypothetical protein